MENPKLSKLDILERSTKFLREFLILIGGIVLILYFLPVLSGLRSRLMPENVEQLTLGPISLKLKADISNFAPLSIPIEAIEGRAVLLEKGSYERLEQVKSQLQATKGARIDALLIVPNKYYSGEMLQKYISLLNIRFVIFQTNRFEGWIDAGNFNAQLSPHSDYSYERLLRDIVGISNDYVEKSTSADVVLNRMQELRLDNIPVLDSVRTFKFMANRQDILSKVVMSAILTNKNGH